MKKNPFLSKILIFSLILAVYNTIAIKLHLYWITDWLDSPSHVLGGLVSALILAGGFYFIKTSKHFYIFLGVLIIGILWEIFEVKYHLTFPKDPGYWLDTLSDIFCDLFGGFISYYYFIKPVYDRN